jgi:hypothetical protein
VRGFGLVFTLFLHGSFQQKLSAADGGGGDTVVGMRHECQLTRQEPELYKTSLLYACVQLCTSCLVHSNAMQLHSVDRHPQTLSTPCVTCICRRCVCCQ